MTKEKAKQFFTVHTNEQDRYIKADKRQFDNFIDLIYDSFENRSCENCKYNKEQDNFMIFCDKEMCQDGSRMMWHCFTKDFCCKYWESKGIK